MTTQEPHPHALESLLTYLVPGFIPEISIAEQPGQDAEYQDQVPRAHHGASGPHPDPSQYHVLCNTYPVPINSYRNVIKLQI